MTVAPITEPPTEGTELWVDVELDGIAGRLNAEHARLVDVAVRLLAEPQLWRNSECRTVERFLAWRTGVTASTAAKIVQVARRTGDLPICLGAFREGKLSLDQFAPIACKVPWWADVEICRQAQMMTLDQIRRTASRYPFAEAIPKPDGSLDAVDLARRNADESARHTESPGDGHDRHVASEGPDAPVAAGSSAAPTFSPAAPDGRVAFWWDDHGRFRLIAELDAATGTVVETALTEARDSLFNAGHTDVDWVDAFREIAERSLDRVESPARRARFRVHVHVETSGATSSATGSDMSAQDARYLTCDAVRSMVHEVDGIPISVGRTQRTVPERTRRTVVHRDGGCRVPGCGDHHWLDVHHIVHWLGGGHTDTDNLICLCAHHHRQHHQGRLGITGNADVPDGATGSVVFTDSRGRVISASGARPAPPGARSATDTSSKLVYRPALRQRLGSRWQHFNLPPAHRTRAHPLVDRP